MFLMTEMIGFGAVGTQGRDEFTVLLLPGDGLNGSTVATDLGKGAKTSSRFGNAQVSTARFKFGSASLLLDGTGDYWTFPTSSDWALPGDFTIDFWAWKSSNGANGYDCVCGTDQTGGGATQWYVEVASNNGFAFRGENTMIVQSSGTTNPNDSTWHHYAVVRSGTTVTLYKDGVSVGSGTISGTITNANELYIGKGNIYEFAGNIDQLRISNGVARWKGAFSPPAGPYS